MKPVDGLGSTAPQPTAPTQDLTLESAGDAVAVTAEPGEAPGYRLGELIGHGGMGEVVLARDRRIGRDVALKRMRSRAASDGALDRFLREAKIQARLDHPAIVPVYELGEDSAGRPYFTMKRLAGITLAQVLRDGSHTRQGLLRIVIEVCRAIDFAHARGIVHRDVKPANIMVGDYGEVYVLDWGIASVIADRRPPSVVEDELPSAGLETQTGDLLGTPGYMAPEQMRGASGAPPADIYSLGAILFELLADEPLHPRGAAALASTLEPGTHSPATRRPDRGIAPELDELCSAALAEAPAERPTARELANRLQAYLDGDRDVARRHALAEHELGAAREALAAGRRSDAMRAAGRALALEPALAGAAELVTALMLEPPRDPPPELVAAQHASEEAAVAAHAGPTGFTYFVSWLLLPVAVWNGVRSWPVVIAMLALMSLFGVFAFALRRRPHRANREMLLVEAAKALLIALSARLCGSLIIAPMFACVVAMLSMRYPIFKRRPWIPIVFALAGWFAPTLFEALGMLGPTVAIGNGVIASTSHTLAIDGVPALVTIYAITIMLMLFAAVNAATHARAHLAAQNKLVAQRWHLEQLLPRGSATT